MMVYYAVMNRICSERGSYMVSTSHYREKLTRNLPAFVMVLLIVQPLMDVLSFWMAEWGMGNALTLLIRLGVLGVTVLTGFCLSRNKKVYYIAGAVVLFIGVGHIFACAQYGYADMVSDLTNYVRVVLMPLTALCLITFLKENEKCYDAMKLGLVTCLVIILAVELLSVLTGTDPHTYMDGKGVLGWFNNTNSQSAILTMLTPIAVAWLYRRRGFRSVSFWVISLGAFAALYFMGPRLCFLGLAAAGFGLGISMVLIDWKQWKKALVFCLMAVVCLAFISVSPMVQHQSIYESVQADRQSGINEQLSGEELEPMDDGQSQVELTEEELEALKAQWVEALTPIYEFYAPDFVEIFGAKKTIEMYDYTYVITDITALRPKKLQFARLLMDDSPVSARFFGLELSRFTVNGNIYDVENDLHGIYFLYGYAGLIAMVAFLGYFVLLILKALIRDAKTYFTWDAAAWGIALIMCLCHVYFTAGVLRRPNAAVYMSVILAAVYYLTRIKKYPDDSVTLVKEG